MVSACAQGQKTTLPDLQVAERAEVEVSDPVDYPLLCEIPWTAVECWQRLDVYEDTAESNRQIAGLNAGIARDSEAAYDHILSAARQQQRIGHIREEMLELERRDHFIDNLWHRALIIIIGAAAVAN